MHRRVGALWIAAGRLANEIWVVSQLNLAPFSGAKMGYTFSFMSTFEKYRDCRLVARQERRGWRVWISETRYRSSLHVDPQGAFEEARKWLDAQQAEAA